MRRACRRRVRRCHRPFIASLRLRGSSAAHVSTTACSSGVTVAGWPSLTISITVWSLLSWRSSAASNRVSRSWSLFMNSIHAFTKRGISASTALLSLNTLKMSNIDFAPRPETTAAALTPFPATRKVAFAKTVIARDEAISKGEILRKFRIVPGHLRFPRQGRCRASRECEDNSIVDRRHRLYKATDEQSLEWWLPDVGRATVVPQRSP